MSLVRLVRESYDSKKKKEKEEAAQQNRTKSIRQQKAISIREKPALSFVAFVCALFCSFDPSIVPVARYSACKIAWHKWGKPAMSVCDVS